MFSLVLQSLLENRKAEAGSRQVDLEPDSNKRKENEDGPEHHTVAVQKHNGLALKGSSHKFVKRLGCQKILDCIEFMFFFSVTPKMRWLNLVVMQACLELRTVK